MPQESEVAGADGGLSADQEAVVARAAAAGAKLDRAISLAAFNGWGAAAMAALSAPFAVMSPIDGVVTVGLAVYAFFELRGRAMLRRLDAAAPARLALNQLGLIALVMAYCAWRVYIVETRQGPSPQYAELQGLIDVASLEKSITRSLYGTVMAVVLLFQGGCARYYLSRRAVLRDLREQTPAWALRVVRAARG